MALALFLLAILLTFLFSFFAQSLKAKTKLEEAKHFVLQKQHFSLRMNQVFSGITALEGIPPLFYTEKEKSLHFLFDNGIDPNPLFSGPVLAKFFLENGNVYLEVEPLTKEEKKKTEKRNYRTELLLTKVHSLSFLFLDKKDEKFPDPSAKIITESLEWRTFWPKEKTKAPSLIRIEIVENISEKNPQGENLSFAFFLSQEDIPVTYLEKPGESGE